MRNTRTRLVQAATLAVLVLVMAEPAYAHPHVFVTVEATALFDHGAFTGIRHKWTFDEYYTEMAIEGLDKNHDGKYDREELSELAKVNMEGLKEFDYFTYAKLGGAERKFKPPVNYWLEHTDKGILTLHFTLPLEQPIAANAGEFSFSVFDPSYFIAFDLAEGTPVKLGAGAPPGCAAVVHEPADDESSDQQKLNQAFSGVLGQNGTVSFGLSKSVAVHCAKS
jgi:ABC-type uncharacterized transport system substrate-binding protein